MPTTYMAANMRQDLALQPQPADSLTVLARLLTSRRAGKLDIVDPEVIESLSDLNYKHKSPR